MKGLKLHGLQMAPPTPRRMLYRLTKEYLAYNLPKMLTHHAVLSIGGFELLGLEFLQYFYRRAHFVRANERCSRHQAVGTAFRSQF